MEKLNISTSLLGFGCMRFPTNADGSINEEETLAMIDKAYQSGRNSQEDQALLQSSNFQRSTRASNKNQHNLFVSALTALEKCVLHLQPT